MCPGLYRLLPQACVLVLLALLPCMQQEWVRAEQASCVLDTLQRRPHRFGLGREA